MLVWIRDRRLEMLSNGAQNDAINLLVCGRGEEDVHRCGQIWRVPKYGACGVGYDN